MAHEHEPHPDTERTGETIEFAAIELEQPERVCYELSDGLGVRLTDYLDNPIEIRIGQTTETSPLFLHEGSDFPELCEAEGADPSVAYVLVQPDVRAENEASGWLVVDKWTGVGRAQTPQFRLGRDISRKEHITLGPVRNREYLEIVGVSKNPTKVLIDRRHRLVNYQLGD